VGTTTSALRDRYWNSENAYFEWTNGCVGGHNLSGKRRGQEPAKERQDNVVASLDSFKRKWLN
jgi:hypothetical protein